MSEGNIWDRLKAAYPKEEERKRIVTSAGFRLDMEAYAIHGTRFCRKCGWRCGMSMYCNTCKPCEQCGYPNDATAAFPCKCADLKLHKHLSDMLKEKEERDKAEEEAWQNRKRY